MTTQIHTLNDFIGQTNVYAPLYHKRTHEMFGQALEDPNCYIDVFNMTIDQTTGDARCTEREDGAADFQDILVRGGADDNVLYLEVEYLTLEQFSEVEGFLERMYVNNPSREVAIT